MSDSYNTGLYAKITLPKNPDGTATYTVAGNVNFQAVTSIPFKNFQDMPTVTKKDQSHDLLPKPRVLGMHPGSAWTSEDFDAPLGGELGFGDE